MHQPGTQQLITKTKATTTANNNNNHNNTLYTASSSIQAPFGWPANPALVVHFGTHTRTPTHSTLLVVAYNHPSAGLPTQRWWCMRLNVCASAVRSCPCGAFGTTNTTHQKHFTSLCPGLRKKSPPKNTASSLQNHKIQTAAFHIKRRYELHPGKQTPSQRTPPCQPSAGGAFYNTHQDQHQHTASNIQAPFGCATNPARVGHVGRTLHTQHTKHTQHT